MHRGKRSALSGYYIAVHIGRHAFAIYANGRPKRWIDPYHMWGVVISHEHW